MEMNISLNAKKVSFPGLDVFLSEDGGKTMIGYYRLGAHFAVLSCAYFSPDGGTKAESTDILTGEDEKNVLLGTSIFDSVLSKYRCLSSSGSGSETSFYATEDGNILSVMTIGLTITAVKKIDLLAF